ncbi:hypothetical protein DFP73DRAFT_598229 [Morchella snyderi]|nr:hypothetical protein DFP73DRAFT_598229 [Morchella snyderi]
MSAHWPSVPISAFTSYTPAPPSIPLPPTTLYHPTTPPSNPPPPQPSRPLSEFHATITSLLSTDYLHSLPLILTSVSPARFAHFRSYYAYDNNTHTLTLRGMQPQLQAVLSAWLSSVFMPLGDILTPTELLHVQLLSNYDLELNAGVRQPDAADIPSAARTWLMGSEGGVEAVVVVNIEEGPVAEQQKQQEEGVVEQGKGEGESPPRTVREEHRSCETEKWVGELTGTIEIFRSEGEEMRRDGMTYPLLPRTPGPEPSLRISELLADTARDDPRTVVLPLEPYRITVRNLAVARKGLLSRWRNRARVQEGKVAGELLVVEKEGVDKDEEEKGQSGAEVVRFLRRADVGRGKRTGVRAEEIA